MTSYVSPVAFTTVAQSIPPNVFADMDRKVAAAVADGADVIDLAKGNPDAFPADFIREVAKKAVDDPANARYSPFDGKPSFLQAAEQWYRNTYGVEVDWKTQLFAVEGAVDGLAALFAVLVSPGDAVAYADPYYPSYHCMTVMSQAEEVLLPSLPERGFLPDLDAVPAQVWNRVKVLVLNYPNNPTGAQAPRGFLQRAIDLAHEYHFAIVQDFAYAGLGVDAQQISILSLPGAFDVAVEVCSLSKMYAMAGWRAGFIAGNDDIVSHVKQYHYQMGSMVTSSIQDAGTVHCCRIRAVWPNLRNGMRLVAKSWQVDCVKSDLMFSIQTVASTLGCMLLKIRRVNSLPTCCWNVRPSPRCRACVLAKWARITYDSACLNPRTSCVRLCAGWLLC